jgi:DNA transformation protein and related proteins
MPAHSLVQHCLELFSPLGKVRSRSMFGGHGLYVDELFIALIAQERLYLKVDAQTQPTFAAALCQPFVYTGGAKPVTMSYWSVPDEAMDSSVLMRPWARLAMQAALAAKSARASKPARARQRVTSGGKVDL